VLEGIEGGGTKEGGGGRREGEGEEGGEEEGDDEEGEHGGLEQGERMKMKDMTHGEYDRHMASMIDMQYAGHTCTQNRLNA